MSIYKKSPFPEEGQDGNMFGWRFSIIGAIVILVLCLMLAARAWYVGGRIEGSEEIELAE